MSYLDLAKKICEESEECEERGKPLFGLSSHSSLSSHPHSIVLHALELLEGRIVDVLADRPSPGPRPREARPARGTKLQLVKVELAASRHTSPSDGTQLAMDRRRRANCARRVWQLTHLDGNSAGEGLFVDRQVALDHAKRHGWEVQP